MGHTEVSHALSLTPSKFLLRLTTRLLCIALWGCIPTPNSATSASQALDIGKPQIQDSYTIETIEATNTAVSPLTHALLEPPESMTVLLIALEEVFQNKEASSDQELALDGIAFFKSRWSEIVQGERLHQVAGDLILFINLHSNKNLSEPQKQRVQNMAISIFKKISQRHREFNPLHINHDINDLIAIIKNLPTDSLNQLPARMTTLTSGEFLEEHESTLKPLLEAGIPKFQFQKLCQDLISSQNQPALAH